MVAAQENPIPSPNIGEWVYIEADFTTVNLPSNASYRVAFTVNGLTLDSGYVTWGAGISGTSYWNLYWGTFIATPGTNQVTAIVDPDHSVPETSYNDNSLSFTFNAGAPAVSNSITYTVAQIRKLEAVLAHELAHLKLGDTVSGSIAVLGFDPLGRHVPIFARIADKIAGTEREALADLAAVGVTRYPPGLISALEKIAAAPTRKPAGLPRGVAESTARLWLAPFDPVADEPERCGALDLSERIDVLREL